MLIRLLTSQTKQKVNNPVQISRYLGSSRMCVIVVVCWADVNSTLVCTITCARLMICEADVGAG